jgi:ABC-type Fe3+-hydroxamate transport system substrate-binding protein
MDFNHYRDEFEKRVIARGVDERCLGKDEAVSLREGRLAVSPFAQKIGKIIPHDARFAVDYYGYKKKSKGFFRYTSDVQSDVKKLGHQVKGVIIPVVHFASIRVEKIAKLAPDLVADFPGFKKEILDARGFKHKYEI